MLKLQIYYIAMSLGRSGSAGTMTNCVLVNLNHTKTGNRTCKIACLDSGQQEAYCV